MSARMVTSIKEYVDFYSVFVSFSFPFDGKSGTLAHVLRDPQGQIHLDEAEDWSEMHKLNEDGTLKTHLKTVIMHELGHIWNISHSRIPSAVMYGNYTGEKSIWQPDDLNAWAEVIGPIKKELLSPPIMEDDIEPPPVAPGVNQGCAGVFLGLSFIAIIILKLCF